MKEFFYALLCIFAYAGIQAQDCTMYYPGEMVAEYKQYDKKGTYRFKYSEDNLVLPGQLMVTPVLRNNLTIRVKVLVRCNFPLNVRTGCTMWI
jgi:hypothetical protein